MVQSAISISGSSNHSLLAGSSDSEVKVNELQREEARAHASGSICAALEVTVSREQREL